MNQVSAKECSAIPYAGLCDACGNSTWHLLASAHAGSYNRCRRCRYHIQVVETETAHQHDRFEAEQQKYYDTDSLCNSPIFEFLEDQRLDRRSTLLSRVLKSGKLIEVGPGRGGMLARSIGNGYQIDAVEHSTVMAKKIEEQHGVNVMVGEFEKIDIPSEHYDAYMSFHVIEHVADVKAHFRKAHSIVKLGGLAIVATPNADSLEHRLPFGLSPNYSSAHLQLFSRKSMVAHLESTGWEVLEISTPAYVEYWVRVVTSIARMLKSKLHGRTIERGKFVDLNPAKNSKQYKIFRLISACTKPLRLIQEKFLAGGELLVIARRL